MQAALLDEKLRPLIARVNVYYCTNLEILHVGHYFVVEAVDVG